MLHVFFFLHAIYVCNHIFIYVITVDAARASLASRKFMACVSYVAFWNIYHLCGIQVMHVSMCMLWQSKPSKSWLVVRLLPAGAQGLEFNYLVTQHIERLIS